MMALCRECHKVIPCSCHHAAQPPYPPHDDWLVQVQLDDGQWSGSPYSDEAKARTRLTERRKESPDRRWRLVRMTTTYTIIESDGEHVGGNAENCPACAGTNPPYPFICPGDQT